ncbi:hypothetical protein EDC94DRAFT_590526 [Helicostylum pulchrum]|nr:hypothetical protein EDC94DRAFT_590526 [Helicostylum pulchrum]
MKGILIKRDTIKGALEKREIIKACTSEHCRETPLRELSSHNTIFTLANYQFRNQKRCSKLEKFTLSLIGIMGLFCVAEEIDIIGNTSLDGCLLTTASFVLTSGGFTICK